MKKRINLSVLLLSVLLTFLTSCVQNLFPDSSYASIAVNLPGNSSARTAMDKSSLSYKLKCETEYGELISEKNGKSGETVTFGELEPGRYVISAKAYLNDAALYSGSVSASISAGESKDVVLILKKIAVENEPEIEEDKNGLFYIGSGNPNFEKTNYYISNGADKVLYNQSIDGFISFFAVVVDDAPVKVAVLSGSENITDISKLTFIDLKDNPDYEVTETDVEILEDSITFMESYLESMGDVEDTPDILSTKNLIKDTKYIVNTYKKFFDAGEKVTIYSFQIHPLDILEADSYKFVFMDYEKSEDGKSIVEKSTPVVTKKYDFNNIDYYLADTSIDLSNLYYGDEGFAYSSEDYGKRISYQLHFESDDESLEDCDYSVYYSDVTDKGYKIYINDTEYSEGKKEDIKKYFGTVPVVLRKDDGTVLVEKNIAVKPDFIKVGLKTSGGVFEEGNMVFDELELVTLDVDKSDLTGKSLAVGLVDSTASFILAPSGEVYNASTLFDNMTYKWTLTGDELASSVIITESSVAINSYSSYSEMNAVLEMNCNVDGKELYSNRLSFRIVINQ